MDKQQRCKALVGRDAGRRCYCQAREAAAALERSVCVGGAHGAERCGGHGWKAAALGANRAAQCGARRLGSAPYKRSGSHAACARQ